jgi:hypothetical protein
MGFATHTVGFRHFTFGRWREPGTPVDASTWPNRIVLEESGYLVKLPPDAEVAVEEGAANPATGDANAQTATGPDHPTPANDQTLGRGAPQAGPAAPSVSAVRGPRPERSAGQRQKGRR